MLNTIDMNWGTEGELLNRGVFEEIYKKLGRNTFDVEQIKQIFKDLLDAESDNLVQMYGVENVEIRTATVENVNITDSKKTQKNNSSDEELNTLTEIKYVIIDGDKYVADNYIDCTQDADIAAAAGAKYTIGWDTLFQQLEYDAKTKAAAKKFSEKLGVLEDYLLCKTSCSTYHVRSDAIYSCGCAGAV